MQLLPRGYRPVGTHSAPTVVSGAITGLGQRMGGQKEPAPSGDRGASLRS